MPLSIKAFLYMEIIQLIGIYLFRYCLKDDLKDLIRPLDVAVILAIPMIGVFGHYKLVFYAFMFLVPIVYCATNIRFSPRYILVLLLAPQLSDFLGFGDFYAGQVSAFMILNLGTFFGLMYSKKSSARQVTSLDLAVMAIFAINLFVAARGGTSGGVFRSAVLTFTIVVPPYLMISRETSSFRDASNNLVFFTFAAFVNALTSIFEALRKWPLYETFYYQLHVPSISTLQIRAGLMRASGAVGNYETLGLITGAALLVAIVTRFRYTPTGRWVMIGALGLGCVLSQARSAWIAVAVGLAFYAFHQRQWKWLAIGGSAVASAALALLLFVGTDSRVGQLVGLSGHGKDSADYRSRLLSRGVEEISRHPFSGQSQIDLQVSMNDLRQGEQIIDYVNTHLLVGLVGGLGVLMVWFLMWTIPLLAGSASRRSNRSDGRDAYRSLSLAIVYTCFTFLTFTSPVDRIMTVSIVAFAFLSTFIRFGEGASAAPRPATRRLVVSRPMAGAL